MVFEPIDDDAIGISDDEILHSALAKKLRGNVAYIQTERFGKVGWAVSLDDTVRFCPVIPAAIGPMWIYLPEPTATVTLRIRYRTVETDSVWLYAIAQEFGMEARRPPAVREEWDDDVYGDEATVDAAAGTITLKADTHGMLGDVAIYLCGWSELSAQVDKSNADDAGGADFQNVSAAAGGWGNPPERAIFWDDNTHDAATLHQFCYWDGGDDIAWFVPPIRPGVLRDDLNMEVWSCGIIAITGMSICLDPDDPGVPGEAAYYIDEPVSEASAAGMVGELKRLVRSRVPMWHCYPGKQYDTIYSNWYLMSAVGWNYAAGLTAGVEYAATVIDTGTADSNGYSGVISVAVVSGTPNETPIEIEARVIIRDWSGGAVVTGDWGDPVTAVMTTWLFGDTDVRIGSTLKHARQMEQWQTRGWLLSGPEGMTQDIQALTHIPFSIPETSITYPCRVIIELRSQSTTGTKLFFAVYSWGIRSRDLDAT